MIHKGLAILDQEDFGEEGEYSLQYIRKKEGMGTNCHSKTCKSKEYRVSVVRSRSYKTSFHVENGLYVSELSHHVHGGGDAAGDQPHPDPHEGPLSEANRYDMGVRDRGKNKIL